MTFGLLSAAVLGNVGWMAWNTMLALAPLALAVVLFRPGRRPNLIWWVGAAAFLALLPNAPYVLTDVVNLIPDLQGSPRLAVSIALLGQYAALFVVGLLSYTASLLLLVRWLKAGGWGSATVAVEFGLHLLCAVGVYLGRVPRLNSWDPLLDAGRVAAAVNSLGAARPVAMIILMFVVICAGYWPTKIVMLAVASYRRPAGEAIAQ